MSPDPTSRVLHDIDDALSRLRAAFDAVADAEYRATKGYRADCAYNRGTGTCSYSCGYEGPQCWGTTEERTR